MVHTIDPNASPSAFKKRLKRITRPQQTGIHTFWEVSEAIRPFHRPSSQSIYRIDAFREFRFFRLGAVPLGGVWA
jgi:hypothetical protein